MKQQPTVKRPTLLS